MLRGVIVAGMVAAVLVPVSWWLGVWGGYEHQLRVAVRHGDCVGTRVEHVGWGAATEPLNARANARFAAFCDELGPMVMWLRFRSAAELRAALAADASQRDSLLDYATVCVSSSRAELVAFDDVQDWKVKALCWLRDGRIVRRSAR
jgi:hypothetical protein